MSDAIDLAVVVVGAGPVGAALACALATEGVPTAVIDTAPLPPMEMAAFDGRAYALASASCTLLRQAGIWPHLPEPPCAINRIRVVDGRPGEPPSPLSLQFDAEEAGTGPFGHMVEARALRVALNARLRELPSLHVFAPAQAVVERHAEGATIRLSSGQVLRTQLVVGAEGRNSPLRRQAGIGVARHDYRCMGLVGAIAHEYPHDNTALEAFFPSGPFAQLPLSGPGGFGTAELPHASGIVWAEPTAMAQRLMALDDDAYAREIARRLSGALGEVRVIGRRWAYPLTAMHAMRYTDTRLALAGDAAHGMHPIAGQGLNIGFRDAIALAALAAQAWANGADLGSRDLLRRYQAQRRPDALMMIAATHALEKLFGNDFGPLRLARRLGIAAVDRVPALKTWFVRQAMGLGASALLPPSAKS